MKKIKSNSRRNFFKDVCSVVLGSLILHPLIGFNGKRALNNSMSFNDLRHVVVSKKEGRFFAWPANNSMWTWDEGNEILIGYTDSPWVEHEGHFIGHPQLTMLARSIDGGASWTNEYPDIFADNGGDPVSSLGNFPFDHDGFALRVAATGYHATDDPVGRFFVSFN